VVSPSGDAELVSALPSVSIAIAAMLERRSCGFQVFSPVQLTIRMLWTKLR